MNGIQDDDRRRVVPVHERERALEVDVPAWIERSLLRRIRPDACDLSLHVAPERPRLLGQVPNRARHE